MSGPLINAILGFKYQLELLGMKKPTDIHFEDEYTSRAFAQLYKQEWRDQLLANAIDANLSTEVEKRGVFPISYCRGNCQHTMEVLLLGITFHLPLPRVSRTYEMTIDDLANWVEGEEE
jgi:hypothetical protein